MMRTHVIQANLFVFGKTNWITVVPTDGTPWKYNGRREAWRYMVENYLMSNGKVETHIEYRVVPESEVE